MVENKIYIGNGNVISLILQDELLHTEWTAWLINTVEKDDEDLQKEIEKYFPTYKGRIRKVTMNGIIAKGGALNCISWTKME